MTEKKKVRKQARTRIRVMIEVDADGCWGEQSTLPQVWKQGSEDALDHLNRVITSRASAGRIRIVGKPQVESVIVEKPA